MESLLNLRVQFDVYRLKSDNMEIKPQIITVISCYYLLYNFEDLNIWTS